MHLEQKHYTSDLLVLTYDILSLTTSTLWIADIIYIYVQKISVILFQLHFT